MRELKNEELVTVSGGSRIEDDWWRYVTETNGRITNVEIRNQGGGGGGSLGGGGAALFGNGGLGSSSGSDGALGLGGLTVPIQSVDPDAEALQITDIVVDGNGNVFGVEIGALSDGYIEIDGKPGFTDGDIDFDAGESQLIAVEDILGAGNLATTFGGVGTLQAAINTLFVPTIDV